MFVSFQKKTGHYKFSQSSNSFWQQSVPWSYRQLANRTPTVPWSANGHHGSEGPESRCWWRRLPLGSPLACNQRETELSLYFFWLTTCFRSGRQTCLYFPNGWLSIWGSISGPEMELNLGYTTLKSLYKRKMHLMWNKKWPRVPHFPVNTFPIMKYADVFFARRRMGRREM